MKQKQRSHAVLGVILILAGAYFLAERLLPGFEAWRLTTLDWPVFVITFGVLLLLIGLLSGTAAMLPSAIVFGGIGGILYWQHESGRWESWSYLWALIPGFFGLGVVLQGLLSKDRLKMRAGLNTILVSAVLLAIFGSFLGPFGTMGFLWPAVLIGLGLYIFLRSILSWG